jgi:hypothetical protein
MEQLREHEFGFATDAIGFPSIQACRAIVYQNGNGLFGYHNLGGSSPSQWATRAGYFADYVTRHPQGVGVGINLFVITFVTNLSGYFDSLKEWKGEAKAFADALHFTGSRFGFNLSALYKTGSAYVELRRAAGTCTIHTKAWNDADITATTAYVDGNNHRVNAKSPGQKLPFISGMNTGGIQRVNYETLM